jgi:hypothetical protein
VREQKRQEVLKVYGETVERLELEQQNAKKYLDILNQKKTLDSRSTEQLEELKKFTTLQDYIIKPKDAASTNIVKVAESADFIIKMSIQAEGILEYMAMQDSEEEVRNWTMSYPSLSKKLEPPEDQPPNADYFILVEKQDPEHKVEYEEIIQKVSKTEEELTQRKDALATIEKKCYQAKNSALKAAKPDEASDMVMEYYHTLADVQLDSQNLIEIGSIIEKEIPLDDQKHDKSFLERIRNKVTGLLEKVEKRINKAVENFKTYISVAGGPLLKALRKVRESLGAAKEAISNAFKSILEAFHNFIVTLFERMFEMMSGFASIASRKGFTIPKIEVKLPSIKFEFGVIPFPVSKIDLPEITVTIEPAVSNNRIK